MSWTVYILECADQTFYTGITNNLELRLLKHAQGTGAKYTKGRGPLTLVFTENVATKSEALKREYFIKRLTRAQKMQLFATIK